ncbi:GAF domain-containing protein [Pontiellaceae bacterium B12227]|nr:GAF domain-containing protein [Pontiellaceae bacterium B12227]
MNEADLVNTRPLLEELEKISSKFLPSNGENALYEILSTLGLGMGVDRTYLFDFKCQESGNLIADQRAEWVEVGQSRQIANPTLQNIDMARAGFSDWNEKMLKGETIACLIRDLPENQIAFLGQMQGIVSILFLPVFKNGQLVGAVGCDDCMRERVWSRDERADLQYASTIISNLCF